MLLTLHAVPCPAMPPPRSRAPLHGGSVALHCLAALLSLSAALVVLSAGPAAAEAQGGTTSAPALPSGVLLGDKCGGRFEVAP